jgi:hypothetical protein
MTKRKVDGVDVNADRIAARLIDRLIAAEKRIDQLQREVQANFDAYAETLPQLLPGGKMIFRNVLSDQSDSPEGRTVVVSPDTGDSRPAPSRPSGRWSTTGACGTWRR